MPLLLVNRRTRSCLGEVAHRFNTYEVPQNTWAACRKYVNAAAIATRKRVAMTARNSEIVKLIKQGMPGKDIAKQFGLAGNSISYIKRKAGLATRSGKNKPTPSGWGDQLRKK